VTRAALTVGLLVLALCVALATSVVQSHNRAEGSRLDALRQDCLLLEAVHGAQRAAIIGLDHAPAEDAR
jgi:hypothetical protein